MSVIHRNQIEPVISLFKRRGVNFYHACQYKDFKTYLKIGGVPSRNLMELRGFPYTTFQTDEQDKNNDVWRKVFGNLSDFGFSFAKGKRREHTAPIPNPYGPILLIFKPEAFYEASDVAICLRSAGGRDFNREAESLSSADEIDRIFQHSIDEAPNEFAKANIKFSKQLQNDFDDPQATSPEVSLTVEDEKISFRHLDKIIVDPYIVSEKKLKDKIENLKQTYLLNAPIWERRYSEGRQKIQQELVDLLLHKTVTIEEIIQTEKTSQELKDWARRVNKGGINWQYDRFAEYLRLGTIMELNNEV